MAEIVFGTVASVAGLASLALQLVESGKKLKDFYDGVKEAPSSLEHLLEHLNTLDVLIQEIVTAEEKHNFLTNGAGFVKCIRICQDAALEALSLLKRLEAAMEKNKRWGGIKMVLKKDAIDKLDKRLDRALNLLHFSCTVNGIKPFRELIQMIQSPSLVVTNHITTRLYQNNDTSSGLTPILLRDVSQEQDETDVEEVIRTSDLKAYGQEVVSRRRKTRFRLPLLFVNKIWEFECARSTCGWQTNFRVRSIVPHSSAIWNLAREADIESIRAMISNGQASILDEDEYGWNLFSSCQWAAWHKEKRQGLDEFLNYSLTEAGEGLMLPWKSIRRPLNLNEDSDSENFVSQLHRRLLPYVNVETDLSNSYYNIVTGYIGPSDIFYEIISRLDPPMEAYSRKIRLNLAIRSMLVYESGKRLQTDDFVSLLGCELGDESVLSILCSDSSTPHHVAGMFGSAMALEDAKAGFRLEEFLKLAIDHGLLDVGTCKHEKSKAGLMHEFSHGYFRKKTARTPETGYTMQSLVEIYTTGMRLWLFHLAAIGVDLTNYGRVEHRRRSRIGRGLEEYETIRGADDRYHSFEEVSIYPHVDHLNSFKILSLVYGPLPADWNVQISWRLCDWYIWEGLAGRFWEMLDFEEQSMPGAWKLEWKSESDCSITSQYRDRAHQDRALRRSTRKKIAKSLAEEEAQDLGLLSPPRWLRQKHKRQLHRHSTAEAVEWNLKLRRKLQQRSLIRRDLT